MKASRSALASPRAPHVRTALCCGRGLRPSRCRPTQRLRAACRAATSPSPTRSRPTMPWPMSCAEAMPWPNGNSLIRCILMSAISSPDGHTGIASRAAMRSAPSDAPSHCRRRAQRSTRCVSASCPAPTTSTDISRPTAISPTKIRTSSCFSATTSTTPSRTTNRSCVGIAMVSYRRRCRPTATVMPNTASTRTCSVCMRKCLRSSPGTTMRLRTTTPTNGRNGSSNRRVSCNSAPRRIRHFTSICRFGRSCRILKAL